MKSFLPNTRYQSHLGIMQKRAKPSRICMLFKCQARVTLQRWPYMHNLVTDSPIGKTCFSNIGRNNNTSIQTLFQRNISTVFYVIPYWNRFVNDIVWKNVWLLPHLYFVTNKVKDISFKLIHKSYPAKSYIKKRFKKHKKY